MLGSAIYPYFAERHKDVLASDRNLTEPWLTELDVRDDKRLQQVFRDFKPDIVLHLAAETSLEFCELNSDVAQDTNARATGTIAGLCSAHNATLVYISTAGVFDGRKQSFYTEDDQPHPIMVYGRTKRDGELLATRECHRTFVVRAGWMMGGGRKKEKKFIYKILQQVKNGCREIFAVDDLWGTPTYTHDFAMNLFSLLSTHRYGTYHMVCEGAGTRYDVAKEILKVCRRDDIPLTPVTSDFFKEEYFVRRPRSEMMTNANLRKIGCHHMRDWSTALREYIGRYFADFIGESNFPSLDAGASYRERRRGIRRPVSFAFSYTVQNENGNRTYAGKFIDLSEEGLCLVSDHAIPPQSIVTIPIPAAGEQRHQAAIVRWVAKTGSTFRIGLKYLEPLKDFSEQYISAVMSGEAGEVRISNLCES